MTDATAARYRALLADDHEPTRNGVRRALEAPGSPFSVCGEAADAPTAIRLAEELRPDVCILDITMPGDGIVAAKQIRRRAPEVQVVMLTVLEDQEQLLRAIRAGAMGYLLKDINPDRLPHAIEGVLAGEAAIPRWLVARLVEQIRGEDQSGREALEERGVRLTDREWDVWERLLLGDETQTVAGHLGVSPVTVRRHVSEVVGKLGATDRADALRLLGELVRGA
jgi:DNA-binding NarL/FixJ family response regulator